MSESHAESTEAAATAQTGSAISGASASLWSDAWRELRRRVMFWVAVVILAFMGLVAAFPSLFTGLGANEGCDVRQAKQRPTSWNPFAGGDHPFGTDSHGCDYWSQIVHGTRAPIMVGFMVTGIALHPRDHARLDLRLLRPAARRVPVPAHRHLLRPAADPRRAGHPDGLPRRTG